MKALVANPDTLNLVPRTYMMQEENQCPQVVLRLPYTCGAHGHTNRLKKGRKEEKEKKDL